MVQLVYWPVKAHYSPNTRTQTHKHEIHLSVLSLACMGPYLFPTATHWGQLMWVANWPTTSEPELTTRHIFLDHKREALPNTSLYSMVWYCTQATVLTLRDSASNSTWCQEESCIMPCVAYHCGLHACVRVPRACLLRYTNYKFETKWRTCWPSCASSTFRRRR